MHKLYGNNIRLTRGDTLAVAVGLWNADGTEYEPNAGDVIRFALKENYEQDTPTVTVKTPAIYARCNATYFATARAPELDQSASKFRVTGKVYRVEREDVVEAFYREFYERYNAEQ